MLHIEQIHLTIPSLTKEYRFLHFSDTHIAYAYPEDTEEAKALAEKQSNNWSAFGNTAVENFELLMKEAVCRQPDALLMAGDIADYFSESNLRYLQDRLGQAGIKPVYASGNHEGASYVKNLGDPRQFYGAYRPLMGDTPDLHVHDFGEFLVAAVDNSDHNIREEQLAKLQEVFDRGLPVLLLMHIPLSTDAILPPMEEKWGKNPSYFMLGTDAEPETTRQFCRMVMAEDSPVAAVFAGHVHFQHSGEFSDGRMQYTTAPGCAFEVFVHGNE